MVAPRTTTSTSRDDLRQAAERWFDALFIRGDADEARALHADAFVDRTPAPGRRPDTTGFAATVRALHEVLPDLDVAVTDLVIDVERARVGVVWTANATKNGRPLSLRGVEAVRFDRARLVVERWGNWPAVL